MSPNNSKTTKYEHVLPKLAMIEDSQETDGLLILLNTVGGDAKQDQPLRRCRLLLAKPIALVWRRPPIQFMLVSYLFLYCAKRHHGDSSSSSGVLS